MAMATFPQALILKVPALRSFAFIFAPMSIRKSVISGAIAAAKSAVAGLTSNEPLSSRLKRSLKSLITSHFGPFIWGAAEAGITFWFLTG